MLVGSQGLGADSQRLSAKEEKLCSPKGEAKLPATSSAGLDALAGRVSKEAYGVSRSQLPEMASTSLSQESPSRDLPQRMERLRGMTIHPAVATAILDEAGGDETANVKFDGFGRISKFVEPVVPASLIQRLENAIVQPLTTVNTRVLGEAVRTDRDLLTRAMYVLRRSSNPLHESLLLDAKKLFLSGELNRESVARILSTGIDLGGSHLIRDQLEQLSVEAARPVLDAERADNIYGRTFESLLIDDLVRNPPASVLRAALELGKGVLGIIDSHHGYAKESIFQELVKVVVKDKRPWFGKSPTIERFVNVQSMGALRECLVEASNGIESIKIVFIAQAMALAIKEVAREDTISKPRWFRQANSFYDSFVDPQKPKKNSIHVFTQNPGNWLHHHPKGETIKLDGEGRSWTYARVMTYKRLSPFSSDALARGQTVICGPSGTTNLMDFLGRHLAKGNPRFDEAAHRLNTLMFNVFDGGHSTQEVLSVLNGIDHSMERGATSASKKAAVTTFSGGYDAIAQLLTASDERRDLEQRLNKAVDRTIDYCATYVA